MLTEIYSLTRIKDQLPPYVEYNHIKVVIASLVAQWGQTTNSEGNIILASLPTKTAPSSAAVEVLDSGDDDVEFVPAPKKSESAVTGSRSAWQASSHTSPGLASQGVSSSFLLPASSSCLSVVVFGVGGRDGGGGVKLSS